MTKTDSSTHTRVSPFITVFTLKTHIALPILEVAAFRFPTLDIATGT